jgi:hypothetical protein
MKTDISKRFRGVMSAILLAIMVFALSGKNLYASSEDNADGPELRVEEWMTQPFELSIEENKDSEDADSADEVMQVSESDKNEELLEDELNSEDELELEEWMSTSWF